VPVVLSREEIDAVLDEMPFPHDLVTRVLYGCGLRLAECLNLRVQCFNFDQAILTVHRGKGKGEGPHGSLAEIPDTRSEITSPPGKKSLRSRSRPHFSGRVYAPRFIRQMAELIH
jgi:integrase